MENQAISLFEYTQRVGYAVVSRPELRDVWVIAELSDVAVRGGHFYTDLIQKNEAGQTVARMRANLWASLFPRLRQKYMEERQDDLRNGVKVKLRGSANHHNIYGLSFNITDIDPSYVDEGDILRRRMEILQQMKKEGIFDDNRQIPLSEDAQRIAVISAEGAAGLGDFINQITNNPEGFRFQLRLFPSPMQGDKAPAGVISALEAISREAESWDCVVIIRGGGATADMNCFDNEQLARNICNFPLPVIVGIGHERDNCVLDYIAHTRCKTPTAVAEFLIAHQRQAWQRVSEVAAEIVRFTKLYLEGERQRLTQMETMVPALASQHLQREKLRLDGFTTSVPLAVRGLTARELSKLESILQQLPATVGGAVDRARERLNSLTQLVGVLSPENTLKRGYSITRCGGKAVKDPLTLMPGTLIETQLASGKVTSRIE